MGDQGDLLSGEDLKQEGMQRAHDHADEDWKRAAIMAAFAAAKDLDELTSDDVWDRIPDGVSTHEYRAMGQIMQDAARAGWIIKMDCAGRKSRRRSLHASPRTVWRSLLRNFARSARPGMEPRGSFGPLSEEQCRRLAGIK